MWSLIALSLCMFSFIWIIHWATNGSTSRLHLGVFAPSYPFQHVFWQDVWSPSCSNFIMFWPKCGCLVYNSTNFPKLLTNFFNFFHYVSNMTWIAPSLNCRYFLMCVHTSINPMGINLLCCIHGNECIGTHDVIRDTFAAIVWDVGFHVGQYQLHVLLSNMFNSSHWQIDIMFTKDGIRTLINIVVVDSTRVDLFPWACATQGFASFDIVQFTKLCYYD
jgi:hypothetical protein